MSKIELRAVLPDVLPAMAEAVKDAPGIALDVFPETSLGSRERQRDLDLLADSVVAPMVHAATSETLARIRAVRRREAAGILHLGGAIVRIHVDESANLQAFWEVVMAQQSSGVAGESQGETLRLPD